MLRRLFLALPLMLALPAIAQDIPADISGSYKVQGRNPDGSAYNGQLTVVESTGGAVAFAWIVAKQSYAGIGVREGRVVTVDWGADTPVVYVIMPGGELHGTWGGGRALERAVR